MNILSIAFQLSIMILPWSLRRLLLVRVLGYAIHPSARIGYALLLVESLQMAEHSFIGTGTIIRGLRRVQLDRYARLGGLNWVSGFRQQNSRYFAAFPDRDPSLHIHEHAAVVKRNLIDCTDRITIGAFSLVAGNHNQLLTHSIDLRTANQSCAPISIGRYCFIGTGSILLKGTSLGDYCVLGAGSVLQKSHDETHMLLSGVPAEPVRSLEPDLAFFNRAKGMSD